MAKEFILTFSDGFFPINDEKGKPVERKVLEKIILQSSLTAYVSQAKTMEDFMICQDIFGQINNADNTLVLTRDDLDKIVKGFELATKPAAWLYATNLIQQLSKPEEKS